MARLSLAFAFGLASVLVTVFMVLPTVLGLIEMGPVSLAQLVVAGALIGTAPFLLILGMALRNGGKDGGQRLPYLNPLQWRL